jgi:small subunit ribosomal protein S6
LIFSKVCSAADEIGTKRKEVIMQERLYDLIFIARPATPEDEIKKVISGIEHTCAEKGAKIEKTEFWGTRKLAYRVAKHREGIYVYQQIRTNHEELIAELERRLRVQDVVIKYLTVRLDEDLKRQKKLGGKREQRAARRPRRTTAAPASAPAHAPAPTPEQTPAS